MLMGGISTSVPHGTGPRDHHCVVVVVDGPVGWGWHIVGLSINKHGWLVPAASESCHGGGVAGVGGLLFVNYIVDASIFAPRAVPGPCGGVVGCVV